MEYHIIRSKRKTVAVHILPAGAVEVRAPLKMPKADIDRFVAAKEKWIRDKLLLMKERSAGRALFRLDYGDRVMVMGREYPITARPGNRIGFDEAQLFMPPGLISGQIKDACIQIYKQTAKRILTAKTFEFAARMGVLPASVKISSAKTRWGSCSGKRSINYSWRLILAEEDVIDYVVVHELAHIKEMNHSARFWAIVRAILPDYSDRRLRLKAFQRLLDAQDWA